MSLCLLFESGQNILVEENESEFVFCDRYKGNRKKDTVKNYFWRELYFILRGEN